MDCLKSAEVVVGGIPPPLIVTPKRDTPANGRRDPRRDRSAHRRQKDGNEPADSQSFLNTAGQPLGTMIDITA
jgi:hypothetical protein